MEITFPDSGRKVVLEGVSNSTLSLLRAKFEQNYPGKPSFDLKDPLDNTPDGDTSSPEFKQRLKEYTEAKEAFDRELDTWSKQMRSAQWALTKLYYAVTVKNPDLALVNAEIKRNEAFVDIREAILAGFDELGVKEGRVLLSDEATMNSYIYLWHVCITNLGEQSLFSDQVGFGSQQTKDAVAEALFRIQRQVSA